ncbi:MAG: hypothetical protein LBQ12_06895 [Deltaproteobacteria bacterium]|jgi:hypothetical protein|nr:hypothetical protein [Deltaproteobacteria bacterium]
MLEISTGLATTISVFAAIVIALLAYFLHNLSSGISELGRKFETRMGAFETRMNGFDTRMLAFETRMGTLETRIGTLETKIDSKFDKLDSKFESLSARVNEIAQDVFQLKFFVFRKVEFGTSEWNPAPADATAAGRLPGPVDPGPGLAVPNPE